MQHFYAGKANLVTMLCQLTARGVAQPQAGRSAFRRVAEMCFVRRVGFRVIEHRVQRGSERWKPDESGKNRSISNFAIKHESGPLRHFQQMKVICPRAPAFRQRLNARVRATQLRQDWPPSRQSAQRSSILQNAFLHAIRHRQARVGRDRP
jgi:hypothetical protein